MSRILATGTAVLCLLMQSAHADDPARSLSELVRHPGDIRAYEILDRTEVSERARRLTGTDFARVERSVSVSVPSVVVDRWYLVGRGCQPHSCSTVKTTIAVDARSGNVYVTTTDYAGTLMAPDRSSWPAEVLALAAEWDTRLSRKTGATSVGSRELDGAPDIVDLATVDQRVIFDHSGSEVAIDQDRGVIVYINPKPSLRGVVRPGQVLFRGTIPANGGTAKGTAFVFRKGCRPAAYSVTGAFSQDADRPTLLLTGDAPRRAKSGCEIVAHDHGGPNSRLEFTFLVSP